MLESLCPGPPKRIPTSGYPPILGGRVMKLWRESLKLGMQGFFLGHHGPEGWGELGFRVQGLGSGVKVQGLGFRAL